MKTWKEIKLVNELDQNIVLNPTPSMKSVELRFGKCVEDDETLYLNKEEIIALKNSLDEMIKHLEL
jgi:hypothetical protein